MKDLVELEKLSPDKAELETRQFMSELKSQMLQSKNHAVKARTTLALTAAKKREKSSKSQTRV